MSAALVIALDAGMPTAVRVSMAIVYLNSAQKPATPSTIADLIGLKTGAVQKALNRLRERSKSITATAGIYTVRTGLPLAPTAGAGRVAVPDLAPAGASMRPGVCIELYQPRNETHEHWRGKLAAAAYLSRRGYPIIGFEVFMGLWVVDVVGVKPCRSGSRVMAIEVKGHRSDWRSELRAIRRRASAAARIAELGPRPQMVVPEMGESNDDFRARQNANMVEFARRRELRRRAVKMPKLLCKDLERMTTQRAVWAPAGVVERSELVNGWGLIEDERQCVRPAESVVSYEDALRIADVIARRLTLRTLQASCYERVKNQIRLAKDPS